MKKFFSFILTLLITFLPVFNINNLSFADSKPNLTAEYAVLMDYETGEVLYSKNGYSKLYPASTTKAWTAYITLKNVKDLNAVVEINLYASLIQLVIIFPFALGSISFIALII